jgi:hypothetical protein
MICWKCGESTANVSSECDNCTSGTKKQSNSDSKKGWIAIDPKKVKTLQDVILVLECLRVAVDPKHSDYKKLKHLLVDH